MTGRRVPISEVVQRIQSWNPHKEGDPGEAFTYIDLSSVDQQGKTISNSTEVPTAEAPSRARQLVQTGDVLVSTVRPNLNGVALVPAHLDGATASTGFCVLRPKPERLDPRYLFHWVKTPWFVADMTRKATGASYPAVSDRIVLDSTLPLPLLEEQSRIAEVLDLASSLHVKRRTVIDKLESLEQSIFFEMFGNPGTRHGNWPIRQIGDYVEGFVTGKSLGPSREGDVSKRRVLKVSAVKHGRFVPTESKPVSDEYLPPSSHFVQSGDLLFSRANVAELVGEVALVRHALPTFLVPDKLWRFKWKEPRSAHPVFIWALFRTPVVRREFERRATGTSGSMKNISQEKVLRVETILPPLDLQEEFARRVESAEMLRDTALSSEEHLVRLFRVLQDRAFSAGL